MREIVNGIFYVMRAGGAWRRGFSGQGKYATLEDHSGRLPHCRSDFK